MSFEFALDPQCIRTLRDLQYFSACFGKSRGVLLAQFPRYWLKLVQQAFKDASPMEKQRLTEILARYKGKFSHVTRPGEAGLEGWLNAALHAHRLAAFDGIISPARPNTKCADIVFHPDRLDTDSFVSRFWHFEGGIHYIIFRSHEARDIPKTFPFFSEAKLSKLVIIDKYMFSLDDNIKALSEFFRQLSSCWKAAPRVIELRYGPETKDTSIGAMKYNASRFMAETCFETTQWLASYRERDLPDEDPHERKIFAHGSYGPAANEKTFCMVLTGGVDRLVSPRHEISITSWIDFSSAASWT